MSATPLHLLLVEDDPRDAELVLAALRSDGFDPTWHRVDNEPDFLARLQGEIDLVVSDYSLPNFTGLRALELTRQQQPDLPFILISGTIGEDTAVEAMKRGATDYLLKDRLTRLGQAVERALREGRHRRERLRTETALRQSEDTLARAQGIAHLGSWALDLTDLGDMNANTLRWSDELFRIFGYEPGEIPVTNENFFRSVHADDRARIEAAVAESLRSGGDYSIEHRIVLPDGSERVVREQASVVKDAAGRPLRMVGTTQDVTEQWLVAEALRESERRLRLVTDNAGIGLAIVNAGHRHTFANDTYTRMTGREASIIGRWVGDVLPSVYADEVRPRLDRALAGERAAHELSWSTAGTLRHFSIRYEPMQLPPGESMVLIVVTDVSQQKEAAEQVRASEARYRALFEYAPDGIVIADRESHYLDANASACRMLGYRREEFIGLHAHDILVPAEAPHVADALAQLNSRRDHHREWRFRRKDGSTFAAEVMATAMPDGNLMAVIRDITERRQTEEAIQAQLSELRRWQAVTIGREEHIINLKREINELLVRQGQPRRYASPEAPR